MELSNVLEIIAEHIELIYGILIGYLIGVTYSCIIILINFGYC